MDPYSTGTIRYLEGPREVAQLDLQGIVIYFAARGTGCTMSSSSDNETVAQRVEWYMICVGGRVKNVLQYVCNKE